MRQTFNPIISDPAGETDAPSGPPPDRAPVPDAASITADLEEYYEWRRETLKDIPYKTVRKAWFTLAHLLLPDGAVVADMGCDDGTLTFCMAALAPRLRFIGVDKSKRAVNKAQHSYNLPNLEFRHGDAGLPGIAGALEKDSLDAIINAFVLHEVFSDSRYSERIVSETIKNQFSALKTGGVMLIHDYARMMPEDFALLEFPDKPSAGKELSQLSEADLLVWYSEQARPKQDQGCSGFFLEELPPRRPRTRLFRLPFKWAYEFIMRKDDRTAWETVLPTEFTYFTMREFRQDLRDLGARVQYSAPLWDDDFIEEHFEGKFRLMSDDGKPLSPPPTSFLALAVKLPERQSLVIEERRPSPAPGTSLKIGLVRNEKTGALHDVVSRTEKSAEIIPYRISSQGRLKVYLHDGVSRGIVNSVPRLGSNLDGKRWSGHMVEALEVPEPLLEKAAAFDYKETVLFARDYLGLRPRPGTNMLQGPDFYPAPDFIDERIFTWYLDVEKAAGPAQPRRASGPLSQFHAKGEFREFDAQQVLNAITAGVIPHARLEMQILSLFSHLGIPPENWTIKDILFQTGEVTSEMKTRDLMRKMAEPDSRFKEIKGTAGQLRLVNSVFVEEGQAQGSRVGLQSGTVDFIVSEEKTINTAVVIPLTANISKKLFVGLEENYLPVPQRHEGNGLSLSVPTFNMPPEITSIRQMKHFIADKFGVVPDMVFKLGESYYTHIDVTPQRIYPFAVAAPPAARKGTSSHFIPFAQYRAMRLMSKDPNMMTLIGRAVQMMEPLLKAEYKHGLSAVIDSGPEDAARAGIWSLPESYEQPPGKDAPGRASSVFEPERALSAAPQHAAPQHATPQEEPQAPPPQEPEAAEPPELTPQAVPKPERW